MTEMRIKINAMLHFIRHIISLPKTTKAQNYNGAGSFFRSAFLHPASACNSYVDV